MARRRLFRWTLILLVLLIVLPVLGFGVVLATFDPDSLKPRIQAAVEQATGRRLTLAGPIGLKLALVPTITLEQVSLANMPGGTRPDMATVRRIEVQLALIPLLSRRIEVRLLSLIEPDLLLETDAQGRGNWTFTPNRREANPAETARATSERLGIAVDTTRIERALLAWRDGRTGVVRRLTIDGLETTERSADAPIRFAGRLAVDGVSITFNGETGSLARLTAPDPTTTTAPPWPIRLRADAVAPQRSLGQLTLEGTLAEPARGGGWQGTVQGSIPDLAPLAALAGLPALPPLRGIDLVVNLSQGSGAVAQLGPFRLRVGENDLAAYRPGLRLARLELSGAGGEQAMRLEAEGSANGAPLRLAGTLGAPLGLLPGGAPFPVDLALQLAEASATLQGTIADPAALTGIDLAATLRAPDLAALSGPAGRPLPPLRDLALQARLAGRGARFAEGLELRGLTMTAAGADAAGDLIWATPPGARPMLRGQLASRRLDLDALLPAPAAPSSPADPSPRPPRAEPRRAIPDLAIPFDSLPRPDGPDAELRWTVAEAVLRGIAYRDIAGTLRVAEGVTRLDPLSLGLPGGRLELRLAADPRSDPPTLQVAARSEGLDLAALAAGYGMRSGIAGRLEVGTDLRGQGRDLRAIAGTLFGHLGLAMVGGAIEQSLVDGLPAELRRFLLPPELRDGIPIRCFALRAAADGGVLRTQALLLDTPLGRLGGGGAINLRDETLRLRLLPDIRAAAFNIRAPFEIGGTLLAPRFGIDPRAALSGGLDAVLSQLGRGQEGLGTVLPAAPADCTAQLTLARGGQPGPAPAPAPPPPAVDPAAPGIPGVPQRLQGPAQQLLRGLFGRDR